MSSLNGFLPERVPFPSPEPGFAMKHCQQEQTTFRSSRNRCGIQEQMPVTTSCQPWFAIYQNVAAPWYANWPAPVFPRNQKNFSAARNFCRTASPGHINVQNHTEKDTPSRCIHYEKGTRLVADAVVRHTRKGTARSLTLWHCVLKQENKSFKHKMLGQGEE